MINSGLILLHKPPGLTSFDSLRDIKRALGTGKAGHTGTLDKFAEGLLLVLTGRALKLSKWFTHCDKQYEGVICFGTETDTLDPEGAVIASAPVPGREAVEQAIAQFCGEIQQAPPAYSAIHIDGERASALARRGTAPEMQKRPVTIYRLELRSWQPPFANIFVHCSSGTYIRSLARDIALAAGSRAYLSALVRTRVAGFKLEDIGTRDWGLGTGERGSGKLGSREQGTGVEVRKQSGLLIRSAYEQQSLVPPEKSTRTGERVDEQMRLGVGQVNAAVTTKSEGPPSPQSPVPTLLPINKFVFERLNIPSIDISPADAAKIRNGKPLEYVLHNVLHNVLQNVIALFSGDEFIAIIECSNHKWNYGYVYARD